MFGISPDYAYVAGAEMRIRDGPAGSRQHRVATFAARDQPEFETVAKPRRSADKRRLRRWHVNTPTAVKTLHHQPAGAGDVHDVAKVSVGHRAHLRAAGTTSPASGLTRVAIERISFA
jgi:hypothetical protein